MSGTYNEYKKYTKIFVDWIVDKSNAANSSLLQVPITLSTLHKRVETITSQENSKAHGIIAELEPVLIAGARAIEKRQDVHNFYVSQSARLSMLNGSRSEEYNRCNKDHKFCIDRLKTCKSLLSSWYHKIKPNSGNVTTDSSTISANADGLGENIFRVLADNSASQSDMPSANDDAMDISSDSDSRTIEQIDEEIGDLRLTLICFMLDLMQLAVTVNKAWKKVRDMDIESNFYTACLETMTAIKLVSTLQAQMQLKYPSIVEVEDLMCGGLKETLSENDIISLYSKNSFMKEFRDVAIALSSFSTSFTPNKPASQRNALIIRQSFFGIPFIESEHPLESSLESAMRFFPRELPELYNYYWNIQRAQKRGNFSSSTKNGLQDHFAEFPLTKSFLDPLIMQFETGKVSITETFTVFCWWKSVLILQDRDHTLISKLSYICRKYMRSLDEKWQKYQDSLDAVTELLPYGRPAALSAGSKSIVQGYTVLDGLLMYQLLSNIKTENFEFLRNVRMSIPVGILGEISLTFVNPVLTTTVLIEKLLLNFRANVLMLQDIPHLPRTICHLYRMFVQEGILPKKYQIMEDFIRTYRSILFLDKDSNNVESGNDASNSSNASSNKVKKGGYLTNFLLSSNFTPQAVSSFRSSKRLPNPANPDHFFTFTKGASKSTRVNANKISDLYRVVYDNDLSKLNQRNNNTTSENVDNNSNNTSSGEFDRTLQNVKKCVNQDIFDLSLVNIDFLPMLTLFVDISMALFNEALKLKLPFALYLSQESESEDFLLSLLTIESSSAHIVVNALSVIDDFSPDTMGFSNHMNKFAAIMTRELNKTEDPERNKQFYVVPRERGEDLYVQEFGRNILTVRRESKTGVPKNVPQYSDEVMMESFFDFMDSFEQLSTTISSTNSSSQRSNKGNSKSNKSQEELKNLKKDLRQGINRMPAIVTRLEPRSGRYQTLLDFFVCDPLQDQDMAEFLLAQGPLLMRTARTSFFGYSHLQLACMDGVEWAVKLLVKAAQGLDFDYGDNMGNTALHFATKHQSKDLANILIVAGANVEQRNRQGKRPCDVSTSSNDTSSRQNPTSTSSRGNNVRTSNSNSNAPNEVDFETYLRMLTGTLAQQDSNVLAEPPEVSMLRQQLLDAQIEARSTRVHQALRVEEKHLKGKKVATAEDIERAERAQQELFAMLDREEKAKKGNKQNSKSNGNKKK